ncbi:MAG: lactate racemase domain-containing protein [Bacillota bacterium]|nr:lactate racemase domain-containing protein [Bacillota bacterium]
MAGRETRQVTMDLGSFKVAFQLRQDADILTMAPSRPLADPGAAVRAALASPIGTPPLAHIARGAIARDALAQACVVISDNTRPVPYRSESGILWPVVEVLLQAGFSPERVTVLVATGTHRPVTEAELGTMLDERVLAAGVSVVNHDCRDRGGLRYLGTTSRGTRLRVSRIYLEAQLKVVTGLVESHFMAGASGGRKAIVPGLVGEESTRIFHGAQMLASPLARDLVLDGNPCHEEALEGARMAGADFTVNVTLDREFRLTGVFAGHLEHAHARAVEALTGYVGIPVAVPYDIVVIHGGRVGINHYQAAKAAVVGASALRDRGRLIIGAHHTDIDPVGSLQYRTVLHLLKLIGADSFDRLILSPDWSFVHDQWEPQMWAKVLRRIPPENLYYCATGLSRSDYAILPGIGGRSLLAGCADITNPAAFLAAMVEAALDDAVRAWTAEGNAHPRVAFLADGPYGIPLVG